MERNRLQRDRRHARPPSYQAKPRLSDAERAQYLSDAQLQKLYGWPKELIAALGNPDDYEQWGARTEYLYRVQRVEAFQEENAGLI